MYARIGLEVCYAENFWAAILCTSLHLYSAYLMANLLTLKASMQSIISCGRARSIACIVEYGFITEVFSWFGQWHWKHMTHRTVVSKSLWEELIRESTTERYMKSKLDYISRACPVIWGEQSQKAEHLQVWNMRYHAETRGARQTSTYSLYACPSRAFGADQHIDNSQAKDSNW